MPIDSPALPPLPSLKTLMRRLPLIFPEGVERRADASGERAAKIAFVMLYAGAVAGSEIWIRPNQVTRMTDEQARKTDRESRLAWRRSSMSSSHAHPHGQWYRSDSREGIRDDTLRNAWVPAAAAVEKPGVPTTASTPRWALDQAFSHLLTWGVLESGEPSDLESQEKSEEYARLLEEWQKTHLSREARTRVELLRRLNAPAESIRVTLPDGNFRNMSPGVSSRISKAVIEDFSKRFLKKPHLVWLSESGNQSPLADRELASRLGLDINDAGILPDIILADAGDEGSILVFCEVVASAGPMDTSRKNAIMALTRRAGYEPRNVALMTSFLDRTTPEFRTVVPTLATGTFAWCASEPDLLFVNLDTASSRLKLSDLLVWLNQQG